LNFNCGCKGRMRALAGIEVKHNRRYGADCVPRLDPIEIAAEIAAPHQNEGPHLAASLRARTSADRSGARGKNDVPGRQRLTTSNEPQDPETVRLRRGGPLPFPLPRLSAGRRVLSRLPYGAPKNGAVLTGPSSPQNQTMLIRGNGSSLVWAARLEASVGPPVGRQLEVTHRIGF
jgi:hypothetical protein